MQTIGIVDMLFSWTILYTTTCGGCEHCFVCCVGVVHWVLFILNRLSNITN